VAAGIAGTLVVAAAGTVFWVQGVVARKWAALQSECADLKAEIERRPSTRPVLRGEPLEGNAWMDYRFAQDHAAVLAATSEPDRQMWNFYQHDLGPDAPGVVDVVAKHRAGLDALQRGARRSDRRIPVTWEEGVPRFQVGSDSQRLMILAAARSQILAREGRFLESAELSLDAAQFAVDLVPPGPGVLSVPLGELSRLLQNPGADSRDIAEIDRQLEILDRTMPRLEESASMMLATLSQELVRMDGSLTSWVGLGVEPGTRPGWRFGFSGRLMTALAYEEIREVCREFCGLQDRPFAEEEARLDYADRMKESPNPLVRVAPGEILNSIAIAAYNRREARARIRLLRAAARYRLDGRVPTLEDPYGTTLHWALRDGYLRIWSDGSDGKDDGGVGHFQTIFGGASPDIVLEVRP
jgi:hypothetical protein